MTKNFIETGHLKATVDPLFNNGKEIFWYGPIYFWFTAVPVKLFGLSIFTFRITALLFGFLDIYLVYRLFRLFISDIKVVFAGILLLASDTLFCYNIHSGRMDSMAFCFVLISWYLFFLADIPAEVPARTDSKKKYSLSPDVLIILSGIFAGISLLTTLRVYFLFIPVGFILLINAVRTKSIKPIYHGFLFGTPPTVFLLLWLFFSFGSFYDFYIDYKYISSLLDVAFHIRLLQYPIIFFTIVSVCYGFTKNGMENFYKNIFVLSFTSIILFYLLIEDTSAYSFFILSCYYFLFVYSLQPLAKITFRNFQTIIFLLMFTWSIGVLSAKTLDLIFLYPQRNSSEINEFIQKNIPPGHKVIGDEMYYYAVENSGSDFQYIHLSRLSGNMIIKEKYQREKYNYDYIIWSDRLQQIEPNILKLYAKNTELKKIASFDLPSPKFHDIFKLLGVNVIASYNCRIYQREKKEKISRGR
ncbi:MAG: glycosyltransferase family 39 protein [Bacteroidota bacterium]